MAPPAQTGAAKERTCRVSDSLAASHRIIGFVHLEFHSSLLAACAAKDTAPRSVVKIARNKQKKLTLLMEIYPQRRTLVLG